MCSVVVRHAEGDLRRQKHIGVLVVLCQNANFNICPFVGIIY